MGIVCPVRALWPTFVPPGCTFLGSLAITGALEGLSRRKPLTEHMNSLQMVVHWKRGMGLPDRKCLSGSKDTGHMAQKVLIIRYM